MLQLFAGRAYHLANIWGVGEATSSAYTRREGQRGTGRAGRRSSMRYLEGAEPGSDTGTLIPEPIDTTAPEQDGDSGESD
jgi:hypothetical protein